MTPRGNELITRYKRKFGIPAKAEVTEQMILAHWELERQLTRELLASTPETRAETFERCYTRLFGELDWLNRLVGKSDNTPPQRRYAAWLDAIGPPPASIYEVGSGKGDLIGFLARCGYRCKGTEITRERGQVHQSPAPNLLWSSTDGVHLDRFEPTGTYDVVVSDQVVEHLHPDDLETHLRSAHALLAPEGKYVLSTPHCYTGPHDLSVVFGLNRSQGMHLKEYTYRELMGVARNAGFRTIFHAGLPQRIRQLAKRPVPVMRDLPTAAGTSYVLLLLLVERLLSIFPGHGLRRSCAHALNKVRLFNENVFLVLRK